MGSVQLHMHGRRVVPEGIDGESRSSGTELGPGDRFYSNSLSEWQPPRDARRETSGGARSLLMALSES